MLSDRITVINPTARLTLTPMMSLLRISRPYRSVPSQKILVLDQQVVIQRCMIKSLFFTNTFINIFLNY